MSRQPRSSRSIGVLGLGLGACTLIACSILYNPSNLDPSRDDAGTSGVDDAKNIDASDDASVDGSEVDGGVDGSVSGDAPVMVDAQVLEDGRVIDAAPDAPPVDAPDCGEVDQACCAGDQCVSGTECTSGVCRACGDALQSCCDPGALCEVGLCVAGSCVL